MSIYLQHFALKREPFSIVPDPDFLYPSQQHRQAVAHLKYGLDREGGFILLTGEVGTGKTTLTRTMLQRIPAHVRVAYVLNSKLNETDLLASICDELAIKLQKSKNLSFSKICIDALNQDLLASHAKGQKTLIVIEEAQNLSADVLETLRLLSNLETNTHKLLHILLVGQPELLEILGQKQLRQLNQRVVSRFHLLPLDQSELSNYINHRLHHAGAAGPIFDQGCIKVLFRLTKGVPRLINLICHQSLLAAYSLGAKSVSPALVKDASVEILSGLDNGKPNTSNKPLIVVLLLVLMMVSVFMLLPRSTLDSLGFLVAIDKPNAEIVTSKAENIISKGTGPTAEDVMEKDNELLVVDDLVADSVEQSATLSFIVEESIIDSGFTETSNPLVNLLAVWSIASSEVYSPEAFAGIATTFGLQSEKVTPATPWMLSAIDRPGIVVLNENGGLLKSYLLTYIDEDSVTLRIKDGEIDLDLDQFKDRWTGSFLYLWRPHKEFDLLMQGDTDKLAMSWLQEKLSMDDEGIEKVITGGRYTEAVKDQVVGFQRRHGLKADGIVGRQTLMRLNELFDDEIPRLTGSTH
ncbi:MAG: general secretion pathway protein A [Porticoccaceae bacterium]|jgi:general secretion pathway protein A|nr:AAA family ATPase [SAR92 clade bacterium]MDB9978120.1 AAA family ATPase [Porticoccaceae bacterium]|tara:strand:+ start:2751 stop:4487 length:1737 start_codon:yes stop_codon:yes gene_type:complete